MSRGGIKKVMTPRVCVFGYQIADYPKVWLSITFDIVGKPPKLHDTVSGKQKRLLERVPLHPARRRHGLH